GEYPVSRPLYFYVKRAHVGVIPGIKEYAEFFMSDKMSGKDGPLSYYGLVSDRPRCCRSEEIVLQQCRRCPTSLDW
ncbi:MAG: substrate-binding domain-containing protein, partial [Pseudomonadota bacterium]